MMEYWNVGFGRLGEWGIGVMEKKFFFSPKVLTDNCMKCYYFIIPPFHYSIIPGWNKQNGGVEIPHYQQFVEFPIQENKELT
jgi:hypothetical protein